MGRGLIVISAVLALGLPGAVAAASQNLADFPAGAYALDKKHSSVTAKVSHLGVSYYTMRFDTADASLAYDPARPEATRVRATVATTSLDVGADYARKFADEFLEASKYPDATFVSTAMAPGEGGKGTMTGDLTLRGVTRPVTFDVAFDGVGKWPPILGGTVVGFSAVARIKRSDFGSGFLQNLVGDEVTIQIEAEFNRK